MTFVSQREAPAAGVDGTCCLGDTQTFCGHACALCCSWPVETVTVLQSGGSLSLP